MESCIAFIGYEEAFAGVNRSILWDTMHKWCYPKRFVSIGRSLYYRGIIVLSIGEDVKVKPNLVHMHQVIVTNRFIGTDKNS